MLLPAGATWRPRSRGPRLYGNPQLDWQMMRRAPAENTQLLLMLGRLDRGRGQLLVYGDTSNVCIDLI